VDDEVALWGVVEFEAAHECPNGCANPTFEVEVMQGARYRAHGRDGWEHQETMDLALLLYVHCQVCNHTIIDRTLEEAVAVEVHRRKLEHLDDARRSGIQPIEKGLRCRRRFALSLSKGK
jgi:hypothetical protein